MCRYILGDQQENLQMEKLETFILDHLSMCKKNERHITYLEKNIYSIAFDIIKLLAKAKELNLLSHRPPPPIPPTHNF